MFAFGSEYTSFPDRSLISKREDRARRARDTRKRVVPELLRSCPRAKHGIAKAELIVDPEPVHETPRSSSDPVTRPDLKIRIRQQDTICVAAGLSDYPFANRRSASSRSHPVRPNVAVLNMCNAVRPGGGFLEGANGQEEYLCHRTTLYPSLWDSFYKLPEVSAIYTPDVLVFRTNDIDDNDLHKRERYFVDVISSSMLKYSDVKAEGCTCSDFSFCDRHRDLVLRKMKAVLRIAQAKGVQRLILGAWGCGGTSSNIKEIAKAWRKVIAGGPRQRRPNSEQWAGIQEIIFAIPDQKIVGEFRSAFSDVLSGDISTPTSEEPPGLGAEREQEQDRTSELVMRAAEVEMELAQTSNLTQRRRLKAIHQELMGEINAHARREAPDSDSEPDDEEDGIDAEAEDYVMSGFMGSDDEHNPFFAGFDARSDGSVSPAASENYEFRPPPPGLASNEESASLDEHSEDGLDRHSSHSSHAFDREGWFHGSLNGLTAQLNVGGRAMRSCSRNSPGSPDLMRPSSSSLGIDSHALEEYLNRWTKKYRADEEGKES